MTYVLNAAHRLRAQPITMIDNIHPSDGDRRCKAIDHTEYPEAETLGTKDGLTMYLNRHYLQGSVLIWLSSDSETVGYVSFNSESEVSGVRYAVGGVYLKKAYRGRGLGTVLYIAALRKLKSISSDANISVTAIRTWKSLTKYGYKVRLWCTTFDKEFNFTWGPDGIPLVDGHTIAKQREEYVLFIKH